EIWAKDDYRVARAVIRMEVALSDGTTANVFVVHLPALNDAATSRNVFVTAFKAWAASFSGPQLVGGDFNAHPGTTPILEMQQAYTEEGAAGGSGSGYTHTNPSVSTRIDYWFGSSKTSLSSISVPADTKDSDHRPVVATFNVSGGPSAPAPAPTATGESTVMSDAFSSLNRTLWPYGVFTGTQDTTIGLAASGGLKIGALKSGVAGVHYNGISTKAYDLSSNGSAYAQLVTAPNTATTAYAMFAVGSDANNYYRWYESGNALVIEKRVGGTKTELVSLPYSATAHQFLRIRREYNSSTGLNEVVFDTAPNNNGAPGTWTERHREAWSSGVNASALRCELKAGTSEAVTSPGTVTWDNFRAALNTP
ncbi:MAG TPA: endonuclease/exonuclease/phosphatase family protein, partial [Vicinamibacterales bacterium]|nr:endonuclease/exonuclease/phosphatase family protein [Vicinamibacterales bacterium]